MLTPFVSDTDLSIYVGDAVSVLRELPERSVHAVLCSPPFWNLRDYQVDGQIGLEETPEEWAASLVTVFCEARRVLRDDGSLWVECGDSYASGEVGRKDNGRLERDQDKWKLTMAAQKPRSERRYRRPDDLKTKDLVGAPFLLAFALRADGWYWRETICWEKPDTMPESATDRCTVSHSYVFHFAKRARYFHDQDAIREPFSKATNGGRQTGAGARYAENGARGYDAGRVGRFQGPSGVAPESTAQLDIDGNDAEPEPIGPDGRRALNVQGTHNSEQHRDGNRWPSPQGRNARSVWRIATEATSFGLCPVCRTYWDSGAPAKHCGVDVVAHFATWPHELAGKIIACATSEAGCCGECGAPRVRETEINYERNGSGTTGRAKDLREPLGRQDGTGFVGKPKMHKISRTLGWRPSCTCDAETIPAVVLDPFGGSGTTARQARAMGRRSILIELSPDYAEIAKHRTRQLGILADAEAVA